MAAKKWTKKTIKKPRPKSIYIHVSQVHKDEKGRGSRSVSRLSGTPRKAANRYEGGMIPALDRLARFR